MAAQINARRPQQERQKDTYRRARSRKLLGTRADIYERDDALIVMAELPEDGEETANVRLDGDELTIRGRSNEEHTQDVREYELKFRISRRLDAARIDATFVNGVLRIVLPKSNSEQL